jgi:hypothetical protein
VAINVDPGLKALCVADCEYLLFLYCDIAFFLHLF